VVRDGAQLWSERKLSTEQARLTNPIQLLGCAMVVCPLLFSSHFEFWVAD